jgi:hypothetical protein
MCEAPSPVAAEQLRELSIRTVLPQQIVGGTSA